MFQVRDDAFGNVKYAGRSKAKVIDNNDPAARGRIVVDHPILGITNWIPYLTAPGMFSVPKIGDLVFVECDCGYESYPVAWGNLNKGDDKSSDGVPDEFNRITPTNRGMYTPAGHTFEMDDGSNPLGDEKGIRLTTAGENSFTILEDKLNEDGLFTITTAGGLVVEFDGTKDAVYMDTNNGEIFELSKANGFQIETPDNGGTSLSMKGGKVEFYSDSLFEITDNNENTLTIDANGLLISDTNNNNITLNTDGIAVEDTNGNKVTTSADGIAVVDANGNEVILDSSGVKLTDANGNEIITNSSGIKATESGGATLNLSSAKVALGSSSAELLDLMEQQLGAFIDNASSFGISSVGPVQINPAVVTLLTQIKTLLGTIKGSL